MDAWQGVTGPDLLVFRVQGPGDGIRSKGLDRLDNSITIFKADRRGRIRAGDRPGRGGRRLDALVQAARRIGDAPIRGPPATINTILQGGIFSALGVCWRPGLPAP